MIILLSIVVRLVFGVCPSQTGLPLALGSRVLDGTTEVDVWSEIRGGVYLVGATTFSDAVS